MDGSVVHWLAETQLCSDCWNVKVGENEETEDQKTVDGSEDGL